MVEAKAEDARLRNVILDLHAEIASLRMQRDVYRDRCLLLRRIDAEAHGIRPELAINEERRWHKENLPHV